MIENGIESSKPNLLLKDARGRTPYQYIIKLYRHSRMEIQMGEKDPSLALVFPKEDEKISVPKSTNELERKTRLDIARDHETFKLVTEILDSAHQKNDEVVAFRRNFSMKTFFKGVHKVHWV